MTKTKNTRQTLIEVGNWLWSMFTINVAWFLINFPVILTMILVSSLRQATVLLPMALVLILMFSLFTLPSLAAVFQAVAEWQTNGDRAYFKDVLQGWRHYLTDFKLNCGLATLLVSLSIGFKILTGNVLIQSLLLVWIGLTLLVILAKTYRDGLADHSTSLADFIRQNSLKLVLATIIFCVLVGINLFLKLAFMILIGSISLAAIMMYKLLNGFQNKKME